MGDRRDRRGAGEGRAGEPPELLVRLRERKARHKRRGIVYRAGTVGAGVLVVLVGIVMSGPGVPGPGILVILTGLALLALEFDRAERLLERAISWVDRLRRRAERATPLQKALVNIAVLAVVAAIVAAILIWGVPPLPLSSAPAYFPAA